MSEGAELRIGYDDANLYLNRILRAVRPTPSIAERTAALSPIDLAAAEVRDREGLRVGDEDAAGRGALGQGQHGDGFCQQCRRGMDGVRAQRARQ